jgi:hypothetical protein
MNALQNEPQRGQPGKTQIQIEALPPLLIASVDDDWPRSAGSLSWGGINNTYFWS